MTLGVYYTIIYYILYYTLLFFLFFSSSSPPNPFSSSLPTFFCSSLLFHSSLPLNHSSSLPFLPFFLSFPIYLLIFLRPIYLSSVLFPHSFYTCRYLHNLIYILPSHPDNSTPHKLSEVNVEWCSFNVCGLCFVLV